MSLTRRTFLKRAAVSGVVAAGIVSGPGKTLAGMDSAGNYAMLHDLTKCDGCPHLATPACVAACRTKNAANFPEPELPLKNYWPQKKFEDWSNKRDVTNRLTPYNWTYVQHLDVEHNGQTVKVHVPRKCMHCDNAPCSTLCPFGVNDKTPEGPVKINPNGCMGGAKCRDVCPWQIPQRQAGVGIYLKIAPDLAGGGVMFKCDMCYDLLLKGGKPACVSACPREAIQFGDKEELRQYARRWAQENQGYIYGEAENGGTSNFYLSKIPFEAINQAVLAQEFDGTPGKPNLAVGFTNPLDEPEKMLSGFIIAPIAGVMAAALGTYQIMKGGNGHEED